MSNYCWGDRHVPHRILYENSNYLLLDGFPQGVSHDMVRGRVQTGDRVRELRSGGNWKNGTVLEGDQLTVRFDGGEVRKICDTRYLEKSMQLELSLESVTVSGPEPDLVPMPVLDDALDGELTLAMETLQPLKEGDRVRIVLANPPLEHLTGLVGTVEGPKTFGLIPVDVEGYGSKILRREQLDLLEPEDFAELPRSGNIAIGDKVLHCEKWLNTVGIVREIAQYCGREIAWIEYPKGPLYPSEVKFLEIASDV